MTDPKDFAWNIPYHQKIMPLQADFRREFNGDDEAFAKAAYDVAMMVSGQDEPMRQLQVEEPHDMPVRYMGSNPLALQFLQTVVRLRRPKRILEVGCFVGLSSMYMAIAGGPDVRVTTMELYDTFAAIARRNIEANGLSDRVEVVVGPAMESLEALEPETFDMAFLDGAKQDYDKLFAKIDPLLRPGGLLLVDDVFFHGDGLNPEPGSDKGSGVKRMLEAIGRHPSYEAVVIPTSNGVVVAQKVEAGEA